MVSAQTERSVVVAGAGMAGLTAAIALRLSGWTVTVFEQAPQLGEIGAGLYTWENGLRVLEELGVAEAACRGVIQVTNLRMSDRHGEVIHETPFDSSSRFCVIPRTALHSALVERARELGVEIRLGQRVAGADPKGELVLEGGERVSASFVIGADGIHSAVRGAVAPRAVMEQVNNGAHRALIPLLTAGERADTQAHEFWNGCRRIGLCPCTPQYKYMYLTTRSDDDDGIDASFKREVWIESFPQVAELIRRIENSHTDKGFKYVFVPEWVTGRVVLLGDAAHAMEPNLGQGAGCGLSAAYELAVQLGKHSLDDGLREWESAVRPMISRTQLMSRAYGMTASQWPEPLLDIRTSVLRTAMGAPEIDALFAVAAGFGISAPIDPHKPGRKIPADA